MIGCSYTWEEFFDLLLRGLCGTNTSQTHVWFVVFVVVDVRDNHLRFLSIQRNEIKLACLHVITDERSTQPYLQCITEVAVLFECRYEVLPNQHYGIVIA